MSAALMIGRLELGPPTSAVQELVGDPVGQIGSAVVPAARVPLQITLDINTILSGASTLAAAQTLRRQIRSALNNGPLKFQMFLYVQYSDDPEQNGWLVPGPMTLASPDGTAWKAVGLWQTQGSTWYLAGRRWVMKEARSIWMRDLRTGLFERDVLSMIVSTEFVALPTLELSYLPNGADAISDSLTDAGVSSVLLPAGRDGGVCQLVTGAADLSLLTFNRAESALNLSDVIVYDRRGRLGPFGSGVYDSAAGLVDPQSAYGWEEVYGPDYPWSWMKASGVPDCPVVENGLVRVRYDDSVSTLPGFCVDVWNGSAYVEQGKMTFERNGDSVVSLDTWHDATLYEYTPDRAVMFCALGASGDQFSHERIYITVQRGERNVRFEYYGAPVANGNRCDVLMYWSPALNNGAADQNVSVAKIDGTGGVVYPNPVWTSSGSGSGAFAASAGTGAGTGHGGLIGTGTLGLGTFLFSENWVAILRYPNAFNVLGAYQTALAVLQADNALSGYSSNANAYGVVDNVINTESQNAAGYLHTRVSFAATVAQQVLEAESMTLGSGTTAAVDASASNSITAQSTRTIDANEHVSQANWPNGQAGSYRVFARAKVSANSASMYVVTPGMTSTSAGPSPVGTAADDAAIGTVAWTNPGNAVNNNPASPATNVLAGGGLNSHYLKFTNFGFNIRPTATILGFSLFVDWEASSPDAWSTSVRLVQAGAITSPEYNNFDNFINVPLIGAGNQWQTNDGQGLLGSDVNASNFGWALAVNSVGGAVTVSVYYAQMFVSYAGANGPVTVSSTANGWYDLGEAPAGGTMEIHGWMSGGAGTFSLDRVEAVLTEDRLAAGASYSGARDQGQAALTDSRTIGALAVR